MLGQLPARLTAEQAAWVLNCQSYDVPVLMAARLLKPLGNPPPNSIKFFATREVLELAQDRTWLAKITHAVNQHWQRKNAQKKCRPGKDSPGGPVAGLPTGRSRSTLYFQLLPVVRTSAGETHPLALPVTERCGLIEPKNTDSIAQPSSR